MGHILFYTLFLLFAVSAAASEPVSEHMTSDDYKNVMLSVREFGSYNQSGAQRPFGEAQLQLLKLAIYEQPEEAKFLNVVDSTRSPQAQGLVDRAAKKVFSSPLFASSFCNFVPDQSAASWNFGVSASASVEIFNHCNNVLKNRSSSKQLLLKSGRKVVFIQTEMPAPVRSWTSMNGDLQVFHEGSLSEFDLIRSLVHEYYVAFDHFWMFSSVSASHYLEETNFRAGDMSLAPAYFNAFFLPLMRGSFQMARAFGFEEAILSELYPNARERRQRVDCWTTIKALATELESKQHFFLSASFFFLPARDRLAISKQRIAPAFVDLIQEAEKKMRVNKSLCEFLITPKISMASTFYASGPRPRIGGGTERTINPDLVKEQGKAPEGLKSLEEKISGTKLSEPKSSKTVDDLYLETLSKQWPLSMKSKKSEPVTPKIDFNNLDGMLEDVRK